MIKSSILFLAAMIAVPAAAQMAAAPASYPPCKAGVTDGCDQSMTSEKYAMSAAQAEKTGGVGDRNHDQASHMGGGTGHMAMHKKHMKSHHMAHMKKNPDTKADAAAMPPQ